MMSETLRLVEALIARPSITPEDAGCQGLVAERLACIGFAAESIVCGLSDAVIETLVDMGLWLEGVHVTLDIDAALSFVEGRRR